MGLWILRGTMIVLSPVWVPYILFLVGCDCVREYRERHQKG